MSRSRGNQRALQGEGQRDRGNRSEWEASCHRSAPCCGCFGVMRVMLERFRVRIRSHHLALRKTDCKSLPAFKIVVVSTLQFNRNRRRPHDWNREACTIRTTGEVRGFPSHLPPLLPPLAARKSLEKRADYVEFSGAESDRGPLGTLANRSLFADKDRTRDSVCMTPL